MNGNDIVNLAFTIGVAAVIVTAIINAGLNHRAELRAETERRDQLHRRSA